MLERLNPWQPITDKLQLKKLGKLGEELGELTSATLRCIIQGVDEVEPVTKKSNRLWLQEEIADVYATLEHVIEEHGLDSHFIVARANEKYERLKTWHEME